MKKNRLVLVLIAVLALFGFTSCGSKSENNNSGVVDIYLPDGTPALALASVLDLGFEYDGLKTEFHFVPAQSIASYVSLDECDLAIMPTIGAATLYNKGSKIKMISNNVFGNLYITGVGSATSLEDLVGKVVYTTANTTIAMFEHILDKNNIAYVEGAEATSGKVTLASLSDGSDIIKNLAQAAKNGTEAYGVLGEPAVTNAMSKVSGLKIIVDFQKEYNESNGYPQACLVGKSTFINNNTKFIENFYKQLSLNSAYCEMYLDSLNDVFKEYESSLSGMTFTSDTIARCNLGLMKAYDIKEEVKSYVKELNNINLDDEFFYQF